MKNKLFFEWFQMEKDGIILQWKKISGLIRGIVSKYHGDLYCVNCLHSIARENKRKSHKKYVKVNIFATLYDAFWRH